MAANLVGFYDAIFGHVRLGSAARAQGKARDVRASALSGGSLEPSLTGMGSDA